MLAFIILSIGLTSTPAFAERLLTIANQCPQAISLYINGESQGLLATGGATNRTFDDSWSGLIYTDANGGNDNGVATTRAGFYGPTNYYYILQDPSHLNTGVSVVPKVITADRLAEGFCASDTCDSISCPSAYQSSPTSFPVPSSNPPPLPLAACPGTDVGYTITFCPEKTFPPSTGTINIHPSGSPNKCLDVRGAVFTNGTAVQIYDCNKSAAQRWIITSAPGAANTSLAVLAGTNFCLDAGANPSSGTGMKIRQCINNNTSQNWGFSNGILKLSTIDQCLDLENGVLENGNQVQTWTCGNPNPNQIWSTS